MFVTPKNGAQVVDPDKGDLLPKNGREVPRNQFWLRRISEGVVTMKKLNKRGKK
ncbi:MAG: DUF2635 domain-containing protein [Gammaproteobacteria bacterium]|nr:DUF2635 domain-containing protein [Gammaproteobacteria bacterium]